MCRVIWRDVGGTLQRANIFSHLISRVNIISILHVTSSDSRVPLKTCILSIIDCSRQYRAFRAFFTGDSRRECGVSPSLSEGNTVIVYIKKPSWILSSSKWEAGEQPRKLVPSSFRGRCLDVEDR